MLVRKRLRDKSTAVSSLSILLPDKDLFRQFKKLRKNPYARAPWILRVGMKLCPLNQTATLEQALNASIEIAAANVERYRVFRVFTRMKAGRRSAIKKRYHGGAFGCVVLAFRRTALIAYLEELKRRNLTPAEFAKELSKLEGLVVAYGVNLVNILNDITAHGESYAYRRLQDLCTIPPGEWTDHDLSFVVVTSAETCDMCLGGMDLWMRCMVQFFAAMSLDIRRDTAFAERRNNSDREEIPYPHLRIVQNAQGDTLYHVGFQRYRSRARKVLRRFRALCRQTKTKIYQP